MTMEPGRELDARVERDVMKLMWDESRCRVCGWPVDAPIGACTVDGCSQRPRPNVRADEPAHYSTDIAAAWPVLEEMRKVGKPLYLIPYKDGWMVGHDNGEGYLDHQDSAFGGTVDSHIFGSAVAATAPHAICLAALKAVA